MIDLADAHIAALNNVSQQAGFHIYNLDTGTRTSILEAVAAFKKVVGKPTPYTISARRLGDIAEYWSTSAEATRGLGWMVKYSS